MRAVVIGAGGAIGAALVAGIVETGRFRQIHALSRRPVETWELPVLPGPIDIADDNSIRAAADRIGGPLDLVLIATGVLHHGANGPERSLRQLDATWLAQVFAVNAIGPALALKAFAKLLPRSGQATIAALSARVGSISDNRAGGWYGYRASKAALNMIVRCAAIELGRTHPQAICVGLHPGTVDSGLSQPFQNNVPAAKLFTADHAAACLLDVVGKLTPSQSGRCFAWDGTEVPP